MATPSHFRAWTAVGSNHHLPSRPAGASLQRSVRPRALRDADRPTLGDAGHVRETRGGDVGSGSAAATTMKSPVETIAIREADTIWHEQGGWFDARWHFSFDRYRDPAQMGVGALRVFNDDRIVAGAEWPMHPHQDIES